ncbi:MAG: UDP-N-acetylglucosamine 2-epimerase (non-hydrolyzing) [Actinobacteria bacterium]|nr:MAG: UDP-N-acetylglucosamine 2-epimerase (non-hydrolyzing) [Actinomycetota bacterium]
MTGVLYIVGARPNFMKVAPVFHEVRARLPSARQVIVHTGQHYDREMSDVFLDELGLPEPDYHLAVGSGGHGVQTGRALERLEPVLERERPAVVVVAGDVNSTLAGALAAAKLELPLAHIEAGLRSFDRTMPEEINRVLVDQISDWCFTHSPEAEDNLLREGVPAERIHFVGNTMIDSLVRLRPALERSDIHRRLGLERGAYALVTLHRPRLVDGPLFDRALASLERLSRELPVVFPVHPRARARIGAQSFDNRLFLIDPVGYLDFLALQSTAAAVITDSGGVQEESTFLGVPCFTLRETTERPITIERGTNRLLGLDVERIEDVPRLLGDVPAPLTPPPGWDGDAACRIVDVLVSTLPGPGEGRHVRNLRNRRAREPG